MEAVICIPQMHILFDPSNLQRDVHQCLPGITSDILVMKTL